MFTPPEMLAFTFTLALIALAGLTTSAIGYRNDTRIADMAFIKKLALCVPIPDTPANRVILRMNQVTGFTTETYYDTGYLLLNRLDIPGILSARDAGVLDRAIKTRGRAYWPTAFKYLEAAGIETLSKTTTDKFEKLLAKYHG